MRCAAVVALLSAFLLPAQAEAKWTEVRSANFLFVGDAPEGQIRDIAQRLEQFHEVMTLALPGAVTAAPVPTVVLVFANGRSLQPVRPVFNGNPIELAGFYQGGDDVSYMAINAESTDAALITIFHEYSHALVDNTMGPLPVWVSEGLAEAYETMEQQRGGKSALLGRAQAHHLDLLNRSTLISIQDLTAVDHRSPMYNEGARRGVFYAQSWALVHYLTFGNPARTAQFRQFLIGVRAGADARTRFTEAFGDDAALERELFDYVRRFSYPAVRVDFEDRVAAEAVAKGRPLDDLDADIYLGDLQIRIGRRDEGHTRLASVLKRKADAPRALVAQGMEHLRGDRVDEALPLLERAAARAPNDAWAQSAFGRALVTRIGGRVADSATTKTLEQSRAVLARAVELDADSAFSAATLGFVELSLATDLPRAQALLERAVRLAPARQQYRLFLAQVLMRRRDFDGARNLLGPLLAGGRDADTRAQARTLLSRLADMKNQPEESAGNRQPRPDLASLAAPARAEPTPEQPPLVAEPPRTAQPTGAAQPSGSTESVSRAGIALRLLGLGETRALGQFRAIECARDSAVLLVDSEGSTLRLRVRKIDDVDFISYRPDGLSSVGCGALPSPQRVLATYRPGAQGNGPTATAGDAVAIELLPDGYTPK